MPSLATVNPRFRETARIPASVDKKAAAARLFQLHKKHNGLTASLVLEDAKNPKSPLHNAITWDVESAAYEFQLIQARNLISAVIFDYKPAKGGKAQPSRAFVHVSPSSAPTVSNNGKEGTYVSLETVLADPHLRRIQVMKALAELAGVRQKYGHLTELGGLWEVIDTLCQERAEAAE